MELGIFTNIFSKLQKQGIKVTPASLRKHSRQGLMSAVFSIRSSQGELIIHIITPAKEWVRQRIWEKLPADSDFLAAHPTIPTARFIAAGKIKDQYFLVQKKLIGRSAGKRLLIDNKVVDKWSGLRLAKQKPELQKIIASLHGLKMHGYGYPLVKGGKLVGPYKSWREFFLKETPQWLKSINADAKLQKLVSRTIKAIGSSPSTLIHGDAINPGNILVSGQKITGLLDWEWAILGDSAWEFCDPGWWPLLNERDLAVYRKARGYTPSEFSALLKRAKQYRLLWILWGAHLHAGDQDLTVYQVLKKMLEEEIAELKKK